MQFNVYANPDEISGNIIINDAKIKCALGKNGIIDVQNKREGDGKTPLGNWPIRHVYWRNDKIIKPQCIFQTIEIKENYGWCDDVNDENYNKFVLHPYPNSAEKLWRDDELYDIIVVLGHNDCPIEKNMGSAIFLHCAKPDFSPTEGCVAIQRDELIKLLEIATIDSSINIA